MNFLRHPLLLLLSTLLLGWWVYSAARPPPVAPANAPDSIFSAARAQYLLHELYPDSLPHVSGSTQNAAMRDRIVTILNGFGYTPEIQSRFHCRPESGRCSPVENILAVRKGALSGKGLLLTAHYDSAWAGPGVADDGAGLAAVLEIARMASQQAQNTYDQIFLLTDAEEQGLLGADAFASHHPLFASVRAVINLESRGVSGPSIMFETGEGNRAIIRMLAKNIEHPVANSIAYEVYRRMPNDTDFSVYRAHKLPGVNFAFTHGAAVYHSRLDDLDHLDLGSLQHHGENAWAMMQAFEERNLDKLISSEDAVYIDLFGKSLLHYPFSSAVGLALLLSILVIVAIRQTYRRKLLVGQVIRSSLTILLLMIALPATGWLLSWPLGRWVDVHPLEHPHPWLGRLTLLLAVSWLFFRALSLLVSRVSIGPVMISCWGGYVLLALVLAYTLPAAGYLGVLPLLAFSLGLVLDVLRRNRNPRLLFAGLGGFFACLYLGFYFFFQLDVLLNFGQSALKITPLILPAVAALPLLAGYFQGRVLNHTIGNGLLVLVVAGCIGQQFLPGYSPDSPRDMNIMQWQDISQPGAWLILESVQGKPDPEFAAKHGFSEVSLPPFDGKERKVLAKPTSLVGLPKIVEIDHTVRNTGETEGNKHHVYHFEIPQGVLQVAINFPQRAGLSRAVIDDQLAFDVKRKPAKSENSNRVVINHPDSGPGRFEFELASGFNGNVMVTSRFDLPSELAQPYRKDWPGDAQPAFLGPRILQISYFTITGD